MSKISELSDGGALQSTDYLIAVRSGGNVKVQPGSMTVDINGGTIDGVTIGGSSAGAITGTTGQFNTSLNVDGIMTSDDATITGRVTIQSNTSPELRIVDGNNVNSDFLIYSPDGTNSLNIKVGSSQTDALSIASGGDISFYDETGSSQSLFWDASAERLGLGTTSPATALELSQFGGTPTIRISNVDGTFSAGQDIGKFEFYCGDQSTPGERVAAYILSQAAGVSGGGDLQFATSENAGTVTERMRIDSSGNVGIGAQTVAQKILASTGVDTDAGTIAIGLGSVTDSTRKAIFTKNTTSPFELTIQSGAGGTAGPIVFKQTASGEAMRIDASGNVGIGTSTINEKLVVYTDDSGSNFVQIANSTTTAANDRGFYIGIDANENARINQRENADLVFSTNDTEAARIDSSGNLLVGKSTSDVGATAGFEWYDTANVLTLTRSGGQALSINRLSSDGDVVTFRKDGTTVGSIGVYVSDRLYISDNNDCGLQFDATLIRPCDSSGANNDNAIDLGSSGARFNDAYITNGVTTGSDGRDKQDIAELDEAERRVAVAAKSLLRKWRWKDAVAKKGDDARIHFGIIAQDLKAAFEAEGLDAGRYAMFIHSTWTDEETGEERSRMGVRYSELLAFIIAAL
jgi:hypothetical protein